MRLLRPADGPVRLPDDWPPWQRLEYLERSGDRAMGYPALVELGERLAVGEPGGVERALVYVQGLPYAADPPGEYVQGAAYTAAWGGDCEDLAGLLHVLVGIGGHRARLVWLAQPWATLDHVSAQVVIVPCGWTWCEPTLPGARVGEDPYSAARRLGIGAARGVMA
jgi:hypothetical protein